MGFPQVVMGFQEGKYYSTANPLSRPAMLCYCIDLVHTTVR